MSDSTGETREADDWLGADAGPAFGLDDLLRGYVLTTSDDGRTWAARIVTAMVDAAARGDARSQHEIFHRIGAAPKSDRGAGAPTIDDETARRVLEAVRGPVKDRSIA